MIVIVWLVVQFGIVVSVSVVFVPLCMPTFVAESKGAVGRLFDPLFEVLVVVWVCG